MNHDAQIPSGKGCVRHRQPQSQAKLLDPLREVLRVKHSSLRSEEAYVMWVRQFLKYHRDRARSWQHPRALGATEVGAFLNHLATAKHVAAATQNQALNAIGVRPEVAVNVASGLPA